MVSFTVDAVLFDMDGTLIDSTPGVVAAWNIFAKTYSIDVPAVLRESHGVRLVDSLAQFCKIEDPELLAKESIRFEEEVIKGGPVVLPGVATLLQQLSGTPDVHSKWTIVTSATAFYTPLALAAAGLAPLPVVTPTTSESVARGKPYPDPYLEGARRVGVDASKTLVIEDAPSGIRSGNAAGATTLAVLTSHDRAHILASNASPDYIVEDLTRVAARWNEGKIEITIRD